LKPDRAVPRPRRSVAPWVLGVLRPLFHYDYWRDAWVLKLIGHRYGPVLLRAGSQEGPEARAEREPLRLHRMVGHSQVALPERGSRVLPAGVSALGVILAAVVVVGAGALGFSVAHSGSSSPGTPALSGHASAGLIRLSFPSGWRQEVPTPASPLSLSDEIALTRTVAPNGTLVVGRTATPNPELLPPSLLAALPSVPAPRTIHLGGLTFYRYLNLPVRGQRSSVYAMSTTAGTVVGICSAPDLSTSFISACEQSLPTIALASGSVLPPGPIPAYASALSVTIKRLNRVRADAGAQLRRATTARTTAKAAYALAAAHAQAATTLSRLNAGPASAANSAVVAALQRNAAAYRALGRSASLGASARYKEARALVARAAAELTAAWSRVRAFGYSIT
jgi:hypothetical protein